MDKYFGFSVIAAIVTNVGSFIALFLKDFLFVKYFDDLKEKRSLKRVAQHYKDPILLTASELSRRLEQSLKNKQIAINTFNKEVLFDKSKYMTVTTNQDKYFLKYRFISTLYRFCAFFGWLELYRQDITFLDSHSKKDNFKSALLIDNIREAIAEGRLNTNDTNTWNDRFIFREELRSIGEGMIEIIQEQRMVTGYGKFQSLFIEFEKNEEPIWLRPVVNFFVDLKQERDFRFERMELLNEALKKLIRALDANYLIALNQPILACLLCVPTFASIKAAQRICKYK